MFKKIFAWLWPWRWLGMVWLLLWGGVLWKLGHTDTSTASRKELEQLYPWAVSRKLSNASNWMGIFIQKRKVGYLRSEQKVISDGYQLTQDSSMQMDILGTKQKISIHSIFWLGQQYQLRRFHFRLVSPLSRFSAKGRVRNNQLIIRVGVAGVRRTIRLRYRPAMLASLLRPTIALQKPPRGKKLKTLVFHPQTLSYRPSLIESLGYESLRLGGKTYRALKLRQEVQGTAILMWLDDKGQTLKERAANGMMMLRQPPREAVRGISADTSVLQETRIPFSQKLFGMRQRSVLRVRLVAKGLDAFPALHGRRQRFEQGILSVEKEPVPKQHANLRKKPLLRDVAASRPTTAKVSRPTSRSSLMLHALQATSSIQSQHPMIRHLATKITRSSTDRLDKLRRLSAWLFSNLRKQGTLGDVSALEVLQQKSGDSNQHAHLFAALARSLGIPCDVVSGLAYRRKAFFFHVWNECALSPKRWISLDATWGQLPVDVSHLAFVRGEKEKQIELLRLLGNLSILPYPSR